MLGFLRALLGLIQTVSSYFTNKQLIDGGKAQEKLRQVEEVEKRVEKADSAVATSDPVRDERLRNRFDRSRPGSGK